MFFQEKFRDSGQTLDEAQDRFELLARETESTLSLVCETSSTVIVKCLIAYLEAFYEYHETCLVSVFFLFFFFYFFLIFFFFFPLAPPPLTLRKCRWLQNLMATDSIKNWRKYVEEKEEELTKKRAAGCGPSKKVSSSSFFFFLPLSSYITPFSRCTETQSVNLLNLTKK